MDVLAGMDELGPEKVVCVSDRKTGMRGVLVIDNTARGLAKGGTRMSPTVSVEEMARLARVMTLKWAGVDLFFGGAKAGILFDPASPAKEAALRAFVRALSNEVPREYVFGLDMGLDEEDAAVIQDELRDRGAVVGTPESLGGVPLDRWGVTGFGVAEAAEAAAGSVGALKGARASVQGFGAVGSAAAARLSELGATVVAVSSAEGALYDPAGLDVSALLALREEFGDSGIQKYPAERLERVGDELSVPCDLLVPAARQDVIDEETAAAVAAKYVVEGANLPTTPRGQQVLAERGCVVVPDLIANAGGAIAGAFAMDSRYSPFPVDRTVIFETVSQKVRTNTRVVVERAQDLGITGHEAGRSLAVERVLTAMELRRGRRLAG